MNPLPSNIIHLTSKVCHSPVPVTSITDSLINPEVVAIFDQFLHFLSARTLPKNVSVNARWKFKLIISIIPISFQVMSAT